MTYEEYVAASEKFYNGAKDVWRRGQTYFNMLYQVRPELAEEIRTSCLDPFYDDTRIPAFLEAVKSMWDIEEEKT